MRTAYLGTSEFAAVVLRRLADSPHRPTLVISRPDRPRGRGRQLASPPAVQAARELGIDVDQPESVNSDQARARLAAASPGRLVVCAFGALIREPLLSEHGEILNVHPSLLPRWRGAAPIERAILAGDERTGVSIMGLTAGLDSGPVYLQEPQPIRADDDYGSLAARLAQQGAELLLRTLDAIDAATPLTPAEQDDALATYADKLAASDRRLDASKPATQLARVVRALSPHVGAYTELPDGTRLGVWKAVALLVDNSDLAGVHREVGIIDQNGNQPVLRCGEGWLRLDVVQPPGKRRMGGEEWLRGLKR